MISPATTPPSFMTPTCQIDAKNAQPTPERWTSTEKCLGLTRDPYQKSHRFIQN